MFANLVALSSLVAIAAAVPATHNQRGVHHHVPAQFEARGYAKDAALLEGYATYHERYETFGCISKHSTSFFDQCCHPLLKSQNEDDLPDACFACDEPVPPPPPIASSSVVAKPVSTHRFTTSYAAPKPTSVKASPTTHKTAPPATTSKAPSSGGGDNGGSTTLNKGGQATYFSQGGAAGACGKVHSDSDLIVAIDIARYGNINAVSALCGKKVKIINMLNQKSVVATIADVCPTCTAGDDGKGNAANSIDLSIGTFKSLESDMGLGTFDIEWSFV